MINANYLMSRKDDAPRLIWVSFASAKVGIQRDYCYRLESENSHSTGPSQVATPERLVNGGFGLQHATVSLRLG